MKHSANSLKQQQTISNTKFITASLILIGLAQEGSPARGASPPGLAPLGDPRAPIVSVTNITQPGSYYLQSNIPVTVGTAITISASGVTLDLNGFTISSTEASPTGSGILLNGNISDIAILNGHIKGNVTLNAGVYSGSGFLNGISAAGTALPSLRNVRVTSVSVSGCLGDGISMTSPRTFIQLTPPSSFIGSCTIDTVGGYGIVAGNVTDSIAWSCGSIGIFAKNIANNCSSQCSGPGIWTQIANNCYGSGGTCILAGTANNCVGSSPNGLGLEADVAINCEGNSSDGILAKIAIGSHGFAGEGGTTIDAYIANSCLGTGGADNILYKFNMP